MQITVTIKKPIRLDKFLAQEFPEKSRESLKKAIKNGEILVNNKKVTPHFKLKSLEKIQVKFAKPAKSPLKPQKIPFKVHYDDEHLAVIEKPTDLIVHPLPSNPDQISLVHGLVARFNQNLSQIDPHRPGIVHRLDKNTSGLIIIAKTDQTHRLLTDMFRNRQIKKTYLALVKGHLTPEKGAIEAPLLKTPQKSRVTNSSKAKFALTHYQVKKYHPAICHPELVEGCPPLPETTYLEAQIITGRTHQIRVHFQSIDHPVIGDPTYGDPKANQKFTHLKLKRPFLHSHQLEFKHPITGKTISLKSPLPKDLNHIIKNLR